MKRILILFVCIVVLAGCAGQRFKSDLTNALQPAALRTHFNTQPANLKEPSKCVDLSVALVNVEKIDENINAVPGAVLSPSWKINPKELTGQIIKYMENSYKQCRVPTNPSSNKIIHISIKEITGWPTGIFRFVSYSHLQLLVYVPEINYRETYTSKQSSPYLHDAMAQSIHDVSWQIINDPTIQDYILCR